MGEGQITGGSRTEGPDDSRPSSIPGEVVREELDRVLASHEFRSSRRSQGFLKYVVENTLNGHGDMLKERTIGIEVFGRSTDYDPSDDATVRVKAGEVRKRLGLYYANEGARDQIRIELPFGTYVPEFRPGAPAPAPENSTSEALTHVPVPEPPKPRSARLWSIGGAVLLSLALIAAAVSWFSRGGNTELDQFWSLSEIEVPQST
jgi:hypothetical protein